VILYRCKVIKERINYIMTTSTIKGVAYWAQVQVPSQYDTYGIIVGQLDDATVAELEGGMLAHRVMHGPDKKGEDYGATWIRLRRKSDDGKPTIVGPDGVTPFDGLIGNGSTVRVQYESWKSKNNFPNGHRILGVQVLELVPYGVSAEASFDDESGTYEPLPDTSVMSEVVFGDDDDTPAEAE
jgi:hypothetical protein